MFGDLDFSFAAFACASARAFGSVDLRFDCRKKVLAPSLDFDFPRSDRGRSKGLSLGCVGGIANGAWIAASF